jgi:hypothetical protein
MSLEEGAVEFLYNLLKEKNYLFFIRFFSEFAIKRFDCLRMKRNLITFAMKQSFFSLLQASVE